MRKQAQEDKSMTGRNKMGTPETGRRIDFWDTTLRDGHQSLWATRMTSAMIEPIAETVGEVGYAVIGIAGAAVFDFVFTIWRRTHGSVSPW